MEWTTSTYRIDELTRRFSLPIVIHVTEGYYSGDTDAEVFSCGDILSIDKELTLYKVAANFAASITESKRRQDNEVDKHDGGSQEILIPLNYKGKLKVKSEIKNYENVRELSLHFPKYATLCENFSVNLEDGTSVKIREGSVVELDRLIPGATRDGESQPESLVLEFQHFDTPLVVAVPTTACGKFRTEPDKNEYTIKEAIDRYKLPQMVRFVDDEIKRVYTQDLLEGIENMKTVTITETLCLNRLVTQNVLVGHYKPVGRENERDTERFRQRTLVVIPLDILAVGEIEVNVLLGVTEDIYQDIFLVRNISLDLEVVDGSLYVDFATRSGVRRIEAGHNAESSEDDSAFSSSYTPPLPQKPDYLRMGPSSGAVKRTPSVEKESCSDEEDYVIPAPKQEEPLKDPNTNICKSVTKIKKSSTFNLPFMKLCKKGKKTLKQGNKTAEVLPLLSNITIAEGTTSNDEERYYEKIDELNLVDNVKKVRPCYQTPPKARPVLQNTNVQTKPQKVRNSARPLHVSIPKSTQQETKRPIMQVAPLSSPAEQIPEAVQKNFELLTVIELEERLSKCGLTDFARICKIEHLDGSFVVKLTEHELMEEPFNLNIHHIAKLWEIKNNWLTGTAT